MTMKMNKRSKSRASIKEHQILESLCFIKQFYTDSHDRCKFETLINVLSFNCNIDKERITSFITEHSTTFMSVMRDKAVINKVNDEVR